jgi:hypothetical protein
MSRKECRDIYGLINTAYLKNGGLLENAAAMANHASTRDAENRWVVP